MSPLSIIAAPSNLGLRPTGVELLASSLLGAGLAERLGVTNVQHLPSPPYSDARDTDDGVLNAEGIERFSLALAEVVQSSLEAGAFPIVLGGDCSILLGPTLALRRRGRYGLAFIDGHADFYSPSTSPTGEAADMDLALVTGRGPPRLANLDGLGPLVLDEDVAALGQRDAREVSAHSGLPLDGTGITLLDLQFIRAEGIPSTCERALGALSNCEGFWTHVDVDVLSDEVMPAVDYLMPDGLTLPELRQLLRHLLADSRAVGVDFTIFNPKLDRDGTHARQLVDLIVDILRS